MLEIIILFCMFLYFVIAYAMVRLVRKYTNSRCLRSIAVAVVILLPFWDALLSAIIFYAACPFFQKASIYETAVTEGIYYEGSFKEIVYVGTSWDDREVNRIGGDKDIAKGFKYVESLITKKKHFNDDVVDLQKQTVYRCIEDRKNPNNPMRTHTQCYPVEEAKSKYMVKTELYEFALLHFGFVKVYERSTKRIMAEYREISYEYLGSIFPFFTWLNWGDRSTASVRCPEETQLFTFQYDVLKPR